MQGDGFVASEMVDCTECYKHVNHTSPVSLSQLQTGEIVVDLGCGAGTDCLLASRSIGAAGTVIGVDNSSDCLKRARKAADSCGFKNADFRLGEIENLPVASEYANVVMASCSLCACKDKRKVASPAPNAFCSRVR